MFVAKALEYTLRRVVLLTVNRSVYSSRIRSMISVKGASFGRFGGWRRRYPGGSECRSIFLTVSRAMPNRLAASRWLRPSTWQASRTRRYRSTVYILPPSISKKIEGYRWQSFTPPAAGKSRRFRGLICHRRSQPSHATLRSSPQGDQSGQSLSWEMDHLGQAGHGTTRGAVPNMATNMNRPIGDLAGFPDDRVFKEVSEGIPLIVRNAVSLDEAAQLLYRQKKYRSLRSLAVSRRRKQQRF